MTGERLCWLSSWISPRCVVADHGVQGDDQLAHDGHEGDLFGFAGVDQLLVMAFEMGIVAVGDTNCHHVQYPAHMAAASEYGAMALLLAAVAIEGGEACKSGNLFGVELAKLRQIGQQGDGGGRAYPGDRTDQGTFVALIDICLDHVGEHGFDLAQLALQMANQAIVLAVQIRVAALLTAVDLHGREVDQLAAAGA